MKKILLSLIGSILLVSCATTATKPEPTTLLVVMDQAPVSVSQEEIFCNSITAILVQFANENKNSLEKARPGVKVDVTYDLLFCKKPYLAGVDDGLFLVLAKITDSDGLTMQSVDWYAGQVDKDGNLVLAAQDNIIHGDNVTDDDKSDEDKSL